ncbi:MAG: hypothetical protein U0641_03150 [Anaerolineae bacterium]
MRALPLLLKRPAPTILAVGAHLKNTVALSIGRQAFISQHIGDLETVEALGAFERVIADFLRLYEAAPAAIAHDMHPAYVSTEWAQTISDDWAARRCGPHPRAAPPRPPPARVSPTPGVEGTALRRDVGRHGLRPNRGDLGGEFLVGDASRVQAGGSPAAISPAGR